MISHPSPSLRSGFAGLSQGARPADRGTLSVRVIIDLVQMIDAALLVAAGAVAFIASGLLREGQTTGEFIIATLAGTATTVLLLRRLRVYGLERLMAGAAQIRPHVVALGYGGIGAAFCLALLRLPVSAIGLWVLAWLAGGAALLSLSRGALSGRMQAWSDAGMFDRKLAVIGVNDLSIDFIARIERNPASRARVVGLYEEGAAPQSETANAIPLHLATVLRGDIETLLLDCRLRTVDAIVIALPAVQYADIQRISARLKQSVADVYLLSDVFDMNVSDAQLDHIGPNRVVAVAQKPLRDWREVQKTILDRSLAGLALLLLAPLLLLVALGVKLTSPGPVLFRQMRMGFNNNLFHIYKFRTMHHHMADRLAGQQTSRGDRRVTRLGRLLRKLSIDELPQLLNVVRGDMSLVGPRPHAPGTRLGERRVDDVVAGYAQRHRVKPGITGLAQVNGFRGEMVTEDQVRQRVQHDLDYIQNWSLTLDLKIMALTVLREINSRRAF